VARKLHSPPHPAAPPQPPTVVDAERLYGQYFGRLGTEDEVLKAMVDLGGADAVTERSFMGLHLQYLQLHQLGRIERLLSALLTVTKQDHALTDRNNAMIERGVRASIEVRDMLDDLHAVAGSVVQSDELADDVHEDGGDGSPVEGEDDDEELIHVDEDGVPVEVQP